MDYFNCGNSGYYRAFFFLNFDTYAVLLFYFIFKILMPSYIPASLFAGGLELFAELLQRFPNNVHLLLEMAKVWKIVNILNVYNYMGELFQ